MRQETEMHSEHFIYLLKDDILSRSNSIFVSVSLDR